MLDTRDEQGFAKLTSLTADGRRLEPGSAAFTALRTTIEDAPIASSEDFERAYTVDWLGDVLELAAPPAANGWTLTAMQAGGGDGMGWIRGTLRRGAEQHQLDVTITDLSGLHSDWIRGVKLDGKAIAKTDAQGLDAVRKLVDGVTLTDADAFRYTRLVVALLRQRKFGR